MFKLSLAINEIASFMVLLGGIISCSAGDSPQTYPTNPSKTNQYQAVDMAEYQAHRKTGVILLFSFTGSFIMNFFLQYPYKKELKSILEAKLGFKVSVCI